VQCTVQNSKSDHPVAYNFRTNNGFKIFPKAANSRKKPYKFCTNGTLRFINMHALKVRVFPKIKTEIKIMFRIYCNLICAVPVPDEKGIKYQ
jgi:hypothetical protein